MITKTNLLKKKPVFLNDFSDSQNVYKEFQGYKWNGEPEDIIPKHLKIIYADYTYEDYSGDAYVLGINKTTKLFFEVHGSHCSCYGLEGQWEEEYYTFNELKTVIEKRFESFNNRGRYYQSASCSESLKMFLEVE